MKAVAIVVAVVVLVLGQAVVNCQVVPDEYIVEFKADVTADAIQAHMALVRESAIVKREYSFGTFRGYAVRVPAGSKLTDASNAFLHADVVSYFESNGYAYASKPVHMPAVPKPKAATLKNTSRVNADCTLQEEATWGLVRTAEDALNIDGLYPWSTLADGTGVTAYILDTGIYLEHSDFEGRATWGYDAVDDPSPETDENGHGTHVAGTILSKTYGLAKAAKAVAVKVLGASGGGTYDGVIAGIQYTAREGAGKKSVANMSLGGGKSQALNNAVAAAVSAGVVFAVAAGNESQDACNVSPASEPSAITVACSTNTDQFCYFSNWGRCTDIIAPGMSITSTWIGGPDSDNTISGTSMSAPHVAGVAAKVLSASTTLLTPTQVEQAIKDIAGQGYIRGVTQPTVTPNLLVHSPCE